jgi:hypothetical protein
MYSLALKEDETVTDILSGLKHFTLRFEKEKYSSKKCFMSICIVTNMKDRPRVKSWSVVWCLILNKDVLIRTNRFFTTILIVSSQIIQPGNTKGGSISVPLASCLTGLESAV